MKKPSTVTIPRSLSSPKGAKSKLRVVFTESQIRSRVRQLAKRIDRDYHGKSLHVVGMLGNCLMFLADLVRALEVPVTYDVLRPEVRDTLVDGTALRAIAYSKVEAAGKDVLLVDGVLKSGLTMDYLYRCLLGEKPKSLRTAALVEKIDERRIDVPTDYVGFQCSGTYLVGYGLGLQERYRNLRYIAEIG